MAKCKDCVHFPVCEPYTNPNESYPEVGGCPVFKSKGNFVEVVRCKDCKHWRRYIGVTGDVCSFGECDAHDLETVVESDEDDFCSYGERR